MLFDGQRRPLLGSWETIVTPKLWSQVQFEWQRRRQKAGIKLGDSGTAPVNKYLLSGILRCSKCHRGLVGHRYQRKSGKIVQNYICPSSDRGGCGGIAISAPAAEAAVEEAMKPSCISSFKHRRPAWINPPALSQPCRHGWIRNWPGRANSSTGGPRVRCMRSI
ncbi:zinc ribbon domain-containing protein [Streptomyces platensis]|uniref:zinc ribbon domain-containing protein n=1 Tax=Streptomyces platensis TaxID=58346 RepID=UPI0036A46EE4